MYKFNRFVQYIWCYTPSQRGNYHHSMFHNPTAAVNLFHVGKQYLTFYKAEAAVTSNLIGRKIISNVKHSDARNSLPILDVIHSSDKRHSASKYCKWKLRQTRGVCYTRIYVLGAPSHFPTEYRHEAAVVSQEHRMKWVVVLGDSYQWPLPWECNLVCTVMHKRWFLKTCWFNQFHYHLSHPGMLSQNVLAETRSG